MKQNWPLLAAAAGFLIFVVAGFLDTGAKGLAEIVTAILGWCSFIMIVGGLTVSIFRRSVAVYLRILSAILLFFVIGIIFVAYCHAISFRQARLVMARNDLKEAMIDYEQLGYITNRHKGREVSLSSSSVAMAGTEYKYFLTLRSDSFPSAGVLAMTTNGVFIWIDAKRGPKLIPHGYRVPFFPSSF
jgi:hypothetical protein